MRALAIPRSFAVVAGLAGLASVVSLASGCPPADPCAAEEPAYGGLGNDEVWLTLKDAKGEAATDGDAPTITSPALGAVLPAGTAPTFEWQSPLKLALGPTRPAPLHRATRSTLDALLDGVVAGASRALVPPAHAHLAPVSSDVYMVDVLVPGRACPVSIVTSELSHELDTETWSLLKGAGSSGTGETLTMQLTSAYLADGRVSEGPFKAADVTFTVE